NLTRRHINEAIKEIMGERFSAKDFRTWAGTLIAACALARLHGEIVPGRTDRRKLMVAAVKETAAQLGNTPAVCKASYIWPSVFPVVLSLAWIFDVNEGRIERTPPAEGLRRSRVVPLLIGIGLLAAAPGLYYYLVVRPHRASAASVQASIAVLPLVNMSGDTQ